MTARNEMEGVTPLTKTEQGYAAFLMGYRQWENPYTVIWEDKTGHHEWEDGWLEACAKYPEWNPNDDN